MNNVHRAITFLQLLVQVVSEKNKKKLGFHLITKSIQNDKITVTAYAAAGPEQSSTKLEVALK